MNSLFKINTLSYPIIRKSLFLLMIVLSSCTLKKEKQEENVKLQNNSIISYANRYSLERKNGYSQVSVINPWQGASDITQKWYLVPRGLKPPEGVDSSAVIFTPIRKIVCMSTTHLAMISALDEDNSIAGVSGTGFLYENKLIRKVENGLIREIGYEDNLNKEMVIRLSPDLVMVYGVGSESAGYIGKIKELGIKVLFNADYLETDPLGKAEWIKLFGALYCREAMADSIFKSIEEKYIQIKVFIKENTDNNPKVLLGLPFKDTWFISPGNSYISRMIEDAGGSYLWHETESSFSMPLGIENVYLKALNADYWLNIGSVNTRNGITSVDPRLADLPCFKKGNIFNNNKRVNSKGGNDYWESGCLKPHVILRDIASILHPELFPDKDLFYYIKIN